MDPARLTNVEDARRAAARTVPRALFDYVDGGADDELTMAQNVAAFRGIGLVPRMGLGRVAPRLSVELFGTTLDFPVLLAPCGFVSAMHPDGAVGVARAAAARGVISVLSAVAGTTPEDVAAGVGGAGTTSTPMWFQLYAPGGRDEWEGLVERVAGLGYSALVVTMDTTALGNRERDRRNGFSAQMRLDPRAAALLALQVASRPRWAVRMGTATLAARRRTTPPGPTVGLVAAGGSPFTWDDIAAIRARWPGALLAKGILTADDARRAVDAGCEGVIVSNHGGRQLDGAPATMKALPRVVDAAGGSATVLVDGGVRRGSDVARALAVGASAVLVGRPYLYGLQAAGAAGVERILDILRADLTRTLTLLGCPAVSELDRGWID
ncbi:MAG: alpha-hydroxy acid oxidase [Acidimicrobiales bacterium]|jgi:isopentenyl diphosphate isomerase/L-lactate dehydrogenase-like FMN-dependent dehydrogenase